MNKSTFCLGDFISECNAFPYSSEYFNIVKEAYEIDVRDLYTECSLYNEIGYTAFQEDGSKEDGFFKKILDFFKSVGDKFVAAINRLSSKCSAIKVIEKESSEGTWTTHVWEANEIKSIAKILKVDFRVLSDFEFEEGYQVKELKFGDNIPEDVQKGFTNLMNVCLINGCDFKEEHMAVLVQKMKTNVEEKASKSNLGVIGLGAASIVGGAALMVGKDFIITKFNEFTRGSYDSDAEIQAANQEMAAFYKTMKEAIEQKQKASSGNDKTQYEDMMRKVSEYERSIAHKITKAQDFIELYKQVIGSDPPEKFVNLVKLIDERHAALDKKTLKTEVSDRINSFIGGPVGQTISDFAKVYKTEIGLTLGLGAAVAVIKGWRAIVRKRITNFVKGKFDNSDNEEKQSNEQKGENKENGNDGK